MFSYFHFLSLQHIINQFVVSYLSLLFLTFSRSSARSNRIQNGWKLNWSKFTQHIPKHHKIPQSYKCHNQHKYYKILDHCLISVTLKDIPSHCLISVTLKDIPSYCFISIHSYFSLFMVALGVLLSHDQDLPIFSKISLQHLYIFIVLLLLITITYWWICAWPINTIKTFLVYHMVIKECFSSFQFLPWQWCISYCIVQPLSILLKELLWYKSKIQHQHMMQYIILSEINCVWCTMYKIDICVLNYIPYISWAICHQYEYHWSLDSNVDFFFQLVW